MTSSHFFGGTPGTRDRRPTMLIVSLIALAICGFAIFFIVAQAVSRNALQNFDAGLLLLLRQPGDVAAPIGPDWVAQTIVEITTLGGYPVLVTLVTVITGFLLLSRKLGSALFVVTTIISGTIASHVLKIVYDRPRPYVVEHLVQTHTASFPSGHATMSAVVYLTFATMIVRQLDHVVVRAYVIFMAVLLSFMVGMSRIYLGVHWPSDVIAGWALGIAWVCLAWLVVIGLRTLRGNR